MEEALLGVGRQPNREHLAGGIASDALYVHAAEGPAEVLSAGGAEQFGPRHFISQLPRRLVQRPVDRSQQLGWPIHDGRLRDGRAHG